MHETVGVGLHARADSLQLQFVPSSLARLFAGLLHFNSRCSKIPPNVGAAASQTALVHRFAKPSSEMSSGLANASQGAPCLF